MQADKLYGGNLCTTSALLTATGAVTTHDTTVTLCYSVEGKALTKTAITTGTTPTVDGVSGATFTALTANKGCIFVWGFNGSGTLKVLQGAIENMAGGSFLNPPQFPNVP